MLSLSLSLQSPLPNAASCCSTRRHSFSSSPDPPPPSPSHASLLHLTLKPPRRTYLPFTAPLLPTFSGPLNCKTTLLHHLLDLHADLRLVFLINEFAASDIDSLLLDSARIMSAFNLSTISLMHDCACCDVHGPFCESLQRIFDSKHNFDCLIMETSGLARLDKFVEDLEEVGINLDVIVVTVDAESLDKIIKLDIMKKQLEHVDLVLLNKCDLATRQVSNTENILEPVIREPKLFAHSFTRFLWNFLLIVAKLKI